MEYRVKQRSLSSLRLADFTNQSVFYLGVQDYYEAVTGCSEHYFSRDTDIARRKLSKCRRYIVDDLWRMVTGWQPNLASLDEVGSFLFYSLWSLAEKFLFRQIVFGSYILVVLQKVAVLAVVAVLVVSIL